MKNLYKYWIGLVFGAAFACSASESKDFSSVASSDESPTTSSAALKNSPGRLQLHSDTRRAFASTNSALKSHQARRLVREAIQATATTPFERELLALYPIAGRIAELSQLSERTVDTEAELSDLIEQLNSKPAAVRLRELTRSSPMSCAKFEQAAANHWAKLADVNPEFARGLHTLRAQCASGANVLEGLWSGFANVDWHSRVVLGDEEIPRSEDTVKVVAGVGGVLLMVAGGVVAALPGGQVVGGIMIAGGVAAFGYAVQDEFIVGAQCGTEPDGTPKSCGASVEQPLLGSNGCLASVNSCTVSTSCGSYTSCAYGCCEAYAIGLAKQENGYSTYAVSMAVPAGYAPNQIGVWAARSAKINDRARVMRANGSGAPVIASTEGSMVEVGTDTYVGDVVSGGNAKLRDRATVAGGLSVSGSVSYGNASTVSVSGPQTLGAAATSKQLPQTRLIWLTTFKDSGLSPVSLEPDQTVNLVPGDYGQVVVKPRAHLALQPGQYHFDGLTMNSDSYLNVPASALTRVDVRNVLNLSGNVVQQGSAQTLMLTYVSTGYAHITQTFAGTLVAPYANVNANVAGTELRASIWGATVELFEGGRVRLATTSPWDLVSGDLATVN